MNFYFMIINNISFLRAAIFKRAKKKNYFKFLKIILYTLQNKNFHENRKYTESIAQGQKLHTFEVSFLNCC